jgi:hypothetical protein
LTKKKLTQRNVKNYYKKWKLLELVYKLNKYIKKTIFNVWCHFEIDVKKLNFKYLMSD